MVIVKVPMRRTTIVDEEEDTTAADENEDNECDNYILCY